MRLEPDEEWKFIPPGFGLPVGMDEIDGFGPDKPWLTWVLSSVIAAVNVLTLIQRGIHCADKHVKNGPVAFPLTARPTPSLGVLHLWLRRFS